MVHRQDAAAVSCDHLREPVLERDGRAGISAANALDTPPNLADYQHAQIDRMIGDRRKPGCHVWIAARAFPQL
jgi:hypothetical protein